VNIAIVEDDPLQQTALRTWLEEAGHVCDSFDNGSDFTRKAQHGNYQVLIFDWELPGVSGIDLLTWLRSHLQDNTPVIFITSRDSEKDIVLALSKGADDYLIKPARKQELLARIDALSRRTPNVATTTILNFNPILINTQRQEITLDEIRIELTRKEFSLACYLLNNIGKLLSRNEILLHVWGHSNTRHTRTLDTHISRLRKKLQLTREQGWHLAAIYQSGYRLDRYPIE
jgi:two-component system response regulator RegX3